MSNHVSTEISGLAPLTPSITKVMLHDTLKGAQGEWRVVVFEDKMFLSYNFWEEGNPTLQPDHETMLEWLIEHRYTCAAWREKDESSFPRGETLTSFSLRGTEEQRRQFRLQEISQEISLLEAERQKLLGSENVRVGDLGLSTRVETALLGDGVYTVANVLERGPWMLLRVPNFGQKHLAELRDRLLVRGFELP